MQLQHNQGQHCWTLTLIPPRLNARVLKTSNPRYTQQHDYLTGAASHFVSNIFSASILWAEMGSAELPRSLETGCNCLFCCIVIAACEVGTKLALDENGVATKCCDSIHLAESSIKTSIASIETRPLRFVGACCKIP